ncbi:sialate O-acetylesterase [Mangrovimonas sp. YM274]|uniref:sialate O-acetylesterase n=1 Tax=Mangrovimonas sp. YM274 TaxID=3070660 RepID=UPI0027DDBD00|nr:sialate O-acetylesterase [Mangrovimonas sp. YM274]WMI68291.1 sialate O-acetylesterase [Mangrovimonas sp. YM274]
MKKFVLPFILLLGIFGYAKVEMPLLFADDMVLQRNKPIPVWGWADANEKIEVSFNGQKVKTKADKDGKWSLELKAEKAGGPFTMTIKGKNTIQIKNILVGEVWICSGQSNMEFAVSGVTNAEQEMNDADYPKIRQFLVAQDMSAQPKSHLKQGAWTISNKEDVANFTAVGFFFAKKLYQELNVPIGLINTTWGGTCVETWTSEEGLANSDEFRKLMAGLPNLDLEGLIKEQRAAISKKIETIQGGTLSEEALQTVMEEGFNDSNWPVMNIPGLWENQQLPNMDGVVWFRKTFTVPENLAGKPFILHLAKVDDVDVTYVNGVEVGTTGQYDLSRKYSVAKGILKAGPNVIAVKVTDYVGGGGIYGAASDLKLTIGDTDISLAGPWKFNVVDVRYEFSPNNHPSLLYNAMVNPLIPYSFQGVIWYQGEANVSRAVQYKTSFPLMINDWRKQWGQGEFPFYFVQLSSFNEFNGNSNNGSPWAELREAQAYTAQTVPNTAMCVTTDIGIATDIHPTNKQDVGKRLAAIAMHNVYKEDVVWQSPIYNAMEVKGNQVVVSFDNIGSGLMTPDKYGYVKGFEVAGKDQEFHYAKAFIKDNKVIVYSDKVSSPIAVRFGWADDAGDCNLYNEEGFPASPFRSDTWKTITAEGAYEVMN